MLERASSSIECSTQLLLRTFERPSRSSRVLGPTFWKHAGDQLNIPAWWPAYLRSVRNSAGIYRTSSQKGSVLKSAGGKTRREEHHDGTAGSISSSSSNIRQYGRHRTFTGCAGRDQQQPSSLEVEQMLQAYDTHEASIPAQGSVRRRAREAERRSLANTQDSMPHHEAQGFDTNSVVSTYENAWTLFVQSGHKQEVAGSMLHYLARSSRRIDLRHALTVFDFIPPKQRTKVDYEQAINVAVNCQNLKAAVRLVTEALSKGYGKNAYFKLMAHCVENTLWNTLATLWASVGSAGRTLAFTKSSRRGPRSPNMAGKYAFHFDNITDFPEKIMSLSDRLSHSDAILAAHRTTLVEICKRLAYIAVESPTVMATIGGKGALELFSVQDELGFESKLHLAAIGTINRMQERGSRSQLAMLIYRNYVFTHPDVKVPGWIYGALISICADAREPPQAYEFLLEEVAKSYGRPDSWSLQQVMAACARQGEVDTVFNIFDQFCRQSKPKDLRDVNHLLHVFAVVGDCENTQAQFDRLNAEFGFTPDIVSWTLLLLSHARSSHSETAFEIFSQMEQAGVRPNVVSWSVLINVAAGRGDTGRARQLYEKARRQSIPNSIYMLGSIVDSLLLNNRAEEAEALVIETSVSPSIESPVRLWNSLYRHFAFKSDSESIHRLQGLMRNMNVKPDAMTYAALMTALVVKGQTSDAVKIARTLHSSQQLNPTEFHYSILIHGFAQEGNRHMATVMYQEMLEHFPRASPSAKLAMLQLRLQREAESARKRTSCQSSGSGTNGPEDFMPTQSLEMLADILVQDPRAAAASSIPNPGFRRNVARNGLEAMYLGSLVSFLQQKGAYPGSEDMLRTMQALTAHSSTSPTIAVGNLALRMNSAIENTQWTEVDEIWREIFATSVNAFCGFDEMTIVKSVATTTRADSAIESTSHPNGVEILRSGGETFRSMLPTSMASSSNRRVLYAHRFALSWPLSLYLQALDAQHRHHDAVLLVNDFQKVGFSLSGRNWNRYIQILSKSPEFDHRLLAFSIFQKHLLPHAPPWHIIRRGKWLSPQQSKSHDWMRAQKPVSRARLEKTDPTLLMPSYFTMIHLATALVKAHRAMVSGDSFERNALQETAPETVELVRQVPYLADRIQGLLLRGRSVTGDREARARAYLQPKDLVGIRGSRSPFDNLPAAVLEDLEKVFTSEDSTRGPLSAQPGVDKLSTGTITIAARYAEHVRRAESRSSTIHRDQQYLPGLGRFETADEMRDRIEADEMSLLRPNLDLAERIMGEMHRHPQMLAAQGRLESEEEVRRRLQLQTVQRLDMIDQIRSDLGGKSLTTNTKRGEAIVSIIPQSHELAPKLIDRKKLIKNLLATPGKTTAQGPSDYRSVTGYLRNEIEQHHSIVQRDQSSHGIDILSKALSHQNQKRVDKVAPARSALSNEGSFVDTSLLRRKISPMYQSDNAVPPRPPEPRRRGAWSINKARRRQRLQEKQRQARLRQSLRRRYLARKEKRSLANRLGMEESEASVDTDSFKAALSHDVTRSR